MKLKQKLINKLTKHLLNTITEGDVVTFNPQKGVMFVDGTPLSREETISLQNEAEHFKSTRLYSLLYGTVSDQAKKVIFEKSNTVDDIRAGKMLLLGLDLQTKIIAFLTKNR